MPVRKCAVLADGLFFVDSRIKKAFVKTPDEKTLLLAMIADGVRTLAWQNTANGKKGKNPPDSVLRKLIDASDKKEKETLSFNTAEEFEAARKKIIGG